MAIQLNDPQNPYSALRKDEKDRRTLIEKQISNITLRQQALENYITLLDNNINQLELQINTELNTPKPDFTKIGHFRKAMSAAIQLVNELHKTYNGYEETKLRCQKEINDSTYKFNHLLEVSIRQLDEKSDKFSDNDFINMLVALTEKFKGSDPLSIPTSGPPIFDPPPNFDGNDEEFQKKLEADELQL